MKILVATANRSIVGGQEKHLSMLIPALRSRGHQVGLLYERIALPGRPTIDPVGEDIPVWRGQEPDTSATPTLAQWNSDIVYIHGLHSGDLEQSLLDRYPAVLFAHGYYGTCLTGRKCHAFPRVQACSRRFGLGCLLLHYPRRCGGLNPGETLRLFRQQSRRNGFLPRYEGVLVASQHMYEEFARHGVAPSRLHLVPLPNLVLHTEAPAQRVVRGRILLAGRLTNIKGGDYLVRALPEASRRLKRELSLIVAGAGAEEQKLQSLASRLGVKTEFHGWVDEAQLHEFMQQADLLAVPSLWPEPFGLIGLEAAAEGLPAVGYDVGGIRQWLSPGESGELAPADPPTPLGLAEAIVRCLGDHDHYARLATGAWKMARQFTLEQHLCKLEMILAAAAKGNRPRETEASYEISLRSGSAS